MQTDNKNYKAGRKQMLLDMRSTITCANQLIMSRCKSPDHLPPISCNRAFSRSHLDGLALPSIADFSDGSPRNDKYSNVPRSAQLDTLNKP